jgi:hypothetical protein
MDGMDVLVYAVMARVLERGHIPLEKLDGVLELVKFYCHDHRLVFIH